jgi:hypothetical protein
LKSHRWTPINTDKQLEIVVCFPICFHLRSSVVSQFAHQSRETDTPALFRATVVMSAERSRGKISTTKSQTRREAGTESHGPPQGHRQNKLTA